MIPPDGYVHQTQTILPAIWVRICLMALRFIWLTGTPVLQVWCGFTLLGKKKASICQPIFGALAA
ncbi:hypothetical protein KCP71_13010 [Salmonella enterica subsp. enterica]|nr:hypothetical protein KCP71_13010 [Salmonella enterica subsp. enterica]